MLEALGRFIHRFRWPIVGAWLLVLVAGVTVGSQVFDHLRDADGSPSAESVKAMRLVDNAATTHTDVVVVVSGDLLRSQASMSALNALEGRLRGLAFVTQVRRVDSVVRDGGQAVPTTVLAVDTRATDDMMVKVDEVDTVRRVAHGAVGSAQTDVGGELALMRDQMATSEHDLVTGELLSMPVLLIALFFVFRGWRAALLPLISSIMTVAGAMLLILVATRFVDVSGYALDVVVLLGLALAVDYSLLIVNRFREERGSGEDVRDAVEATLSKSGRTLIFSAMTVIAALSGLFLFQNPTFDSLAVGGITTVLVALAAGLTLTPALTALWGRKITGTLPSAASERGLFWRLARNVQRRPLLITFVTTSVLVAMAIPFFAAQFSSGDYRVLPTSVESRRATDTVRKAVPSLASDPIEIVVPNLPSAPEFNRYVRFVSRLPGVLDVDPGSPTSSLSVISVTAQGTSQGASARQIVQSLREHRPSFEILVTGRAAALLDFEHQVTNRLPFVLAFVALMTMLLLFLMTGSVLVPVKAVLMNTMSLGATFGSLVWVFQEGHLANVLHFESPGAIEVWVPVLVFVFGFGLSMDYEVFLLSRIKEAYDRTGKSNDAVASGLQRSGRIITSAALLVIIVFLGFAAGDNLGIKEMGLALAIVVLVDATLVRCLLVPAVMTLLGNLNWWAPGWLRRLHVRFGLQELPAAGPTTTQRPVGTLTRSTGSTA